MRSSDHAPGGRRTEKVYRSLLSDIRAGRFEVHSKLPTEHELATTFSVSRPVIRNALALLRQDGLVRSIQGSGSVVIFDHHSRSLALPEETAGGSVRDLQRCFEFRMLVEGEAAFAAALRHDLRSLERIADSIYAARDPEPMPQPSRTSQTFDFHRAVAVAADNPFLQHSLDMIVASAGFRVYLSRRGRGANAVAELAQVNAEHIEIFRQIERRQATEAREAMRGHIQRAHDYFMESIPLTE